MSDFWTERKKFDQSGDYNIYDWTNKTIVLDLTNSIGEQYHFEIEPEADASSIPSRPSGGPNDNIRLEMYLPLFGVLPPLPHPTNGKSKVKK